MKTKYRDLETGERVVVGDEMQARFSRLWEKVVNDKIEGKDIYVGQPPVENFKFRRKIKEVVKEKPENETLFGELSENN